MGRYHLCNCETVTVVVSFGQPQEGNRTKSNFSLMRCPFQQSSSLQDAGCSVKDTRLGRAAWCQGDPGPGASILSCSLKPHSGAMSRSQAEPLRRSALMILYGARQGRDIASSDAGNLVGTAHPSCSVGSNHWKHHCFQETSSISAAYSKQLCGMINTVNIFK